MIQFCINSAQSNMPFMKVTAYASYFPVTASFKLKLNLCGIAKKLAMRTKEKFLSMLALRNLMAVTWKTKFM